MDLAKQWYILCERCKTRDLVTHNQYMAQLKTWMDNARCPTCGEWRYFTTHACEAARASLRPFMGNARKQIRAQVDSDEEAEWVVKRLKYTVGCSEQEVKAGTVIELPREIYWSHPRGRPRIKVVLED